jgi:hypothetical protein
MCREEGTTQDRVTCFLAKNRNCVPGQEAKGANNYTSTLYSPAQVEISRLSKKYHPQIQTSTFIKQCGSGSAVPLFDELCENTGGLRYCAKLYTFL